MTKLEYAASFRDLIVYQKAKEPLLPIFKRTKRFPKEEHARYFIVSAPRTED